MFFLKMNGGLQPSAIKPEVTRVTWHIITKKKYNTEMLKWYIYVLGFPKFYFVLTFASLIQLV